MGSTVPQETVLCQRLNAWSEQLMSAADLKRSAWRKRYPQRVPWKKFGPNWKIDEDSSFCIPQELYGRSLSFDGLDDFPLVSGRSPTFLALARAAWCHTCLPFAICLPFLSPVSHQSNIFACHTCLPFVSSSVSYLLVSCCFPLGSLSMVDSPHQQHIPMMRILSQILFLNHALQLFGACASIVNSFSQT